MKDNFSTQAATYARFRPNYPDEYIDYIVSFVKEKKLALDVATGNGQVAEKLARHFDKVYGTDISEKQLENAVQKNNVVYKVAKAEQTDFQNGSFDLITVAQAIHWFEFDAFYKEIYRLLKPDGIFAVLGYGLFSTNPDSDVFLRKLHREILGPYWDPERRYVDEDYKTIPFPLDEVEIEEGKFAETFTWNFEHLLGYIASWSATQHYIKQNGHDPVDLIRGELKESWAKGDGKAHFPLLLRIGKKQMR